MFVYRVCLIYDREVIISISVLYIFEFCVMFWEKLSFFSVLVCICILYVYRFVCVCVCVIEY